MSTAAPGRYSYENSIATFLDQATYQVLLRRAAAILQREPRGHLLEPADLVHDSVLRIARTAVPVRFHSTGHLVALATMIMRRVIVDYSRSAKSAKRRISAPLAGERLLAPGAVDALIVRDALARLAPRGDRIFRIVEMRFYDGFDIEEIACALDISSRTVKRDWNAARERLLGLLRPRSGFEDPIWPLARKGGTPETESRPAPAIPGHAPVAYSWRVRSGRE